MPPRPQRLSSDQSKSGRPAPSGAEQAEHAVQAGGALVPQGAAALGPAQVAALQRTIGNQGVMRLLGGGAGQTTPAPAPVQARFVANASGGTDLSGIQNQWNSLLAWRDAHATITYPAAMEGHITDFEGDYYDATFEQQVTAVRVLCDYIKEGVETLRQDENGAANLDWDAFRGFLQGLAALGLVTVSGLDAERDLTGGHGRGYLWRARVASTGADIATGSIPNAAHGRSDGARGGTRGTIRTVIQAHNTAVNTAKAAVEALRW